MHTESLGNLVGDVLLPVLSQLNRVRLQENMWYRQCSKSWTIWPSIGRIKTLNRGVRKPVERTISDQSRQVEMPSALIETLTELILLHVTVVGLEHRRRSAESQTVSTQIAAENKIDDDVLSKLPCQPPRGRSFVRRFHTFTRK